MLSLDITDVLILVVPLVDAYVGDDGHAEDYHNGDNPNDKTRSCANFVRTFLLNCHLDNLFDHLLALDDNSLHALIVHLVTWELFVGDHNRVRVGGCSTILLVLISRLINHRFRVVKVFN